MAAPAMARFLVINGPNLNFLGKRDPGIYGETTLEEIGAMVCRRAQALGVKVEFFQSNSEGAIVDFIQENYGEAQGIIINPGALTHYGYSLRDALLDCRMPFVEVHLSNIHAREAWRRRSVVADIARGHISGLGWRGYTSALEVLVALEAEEGPK